MSTRGILFDLDGTLLDTAPEFVTCMNRLLAEESLSPITELFLRPAVSTGTHGMVSLAFSLSQGDPKLNDLKQRFLAYYAENIGFQTNFFDGIVELLHGLNEKTIPWGIVTNKTTKFTLPLIEKFPILQKAASVVSGDTLLVSKPHPDPLLLAASEIGVPAKHCWYVGDAKTDVDASKAASMRSVVARYGYIPSNTDPAIWAADHYIQNPREISALLSS